MKRNNLQLHGMMKPFRHRLNFSLSINLFVTYLLTLGSSTATDPSQFINTLTDLTNALGVSEFQQQINDNGNIEISNTSPNGKQLVSQISSDIAAMAQTLIQGAFAQKLAYEDNLNPDITIQLCCNLTNLKPDPRFQLIPVDTTRACHITEEAMTVNSAVVKQMQTNLDTIPHVNWQFYGTEQGEHCTYPARNLCNETSTYDPRYRVWYTATVNSPKDIVMLIDQSFSMGDSFSTSSPNSKLEVAQNAAASVLKYLNANDRVAVVAFSDTLQTDSSCFSQELAVGTPQNIAALSQFVERLSVSTVEDRAQYKLALTKASQLFNTTDNRSTSGLYSNSQKVIMLMTDGNPLESCQEIAALERSLFNNTVNIFPFAVGQDSNGQTCLEILAAGSRGIMGTVPDSNFADLRGELPFYYEAFQNQIDTTNVTVSVPFIDLSGLGSSIAICLPLFGSDNDLAGVSCVQTNVNSVFDEIVDFQLGRLSYGFVIDQRGRVILHPLLPEPAYWSQPLTLLEMVQVDFSPNSAEIERRILSGLPGNETVLNLKWFQSIGQSEQQGVKKFSTFATYFWHAVPSLKFFVCLVIVQNETNMTLITSSFPPIILLADQLDLNASNTDRKCINFDRLISNTNMTVLKLAPMAFVNASSYMYSPDLSSSDVSEMEGYLTETEGKPTNFPIKTGLRDVVSATYALESVWITKYYRLPTTVRQHVLSMYVGMKEGVFRRFPPLRIDRDFDPTVQPWYRTAVDQSGSIVLSLPFVDVASGVPVVSVSQSIYSNGPVLSASTDQIVGAIGIDVTMMYLFEQLTSTIDLCHTGSNECFAIDLSGFIVIHKNFLTNMSVSNTHITEMEPLIAWEFIENAALEQDLCIRYGDATLTEQIFWKVSVPGSSSCQSFTYSTICQVGEQTSNIFIVVKNSISISNDNINPGSCMCNSNIADGSCVYNLTGTSIPKCQCPCILPVYSYDNCIANLNIDIVTWKPCLSEQNVDSVDVTNVVLDDQLLINNNNNRGSLQSCMACDLFTEQMLCSVNGCFWTESSCSKSESRASASSSSQSLITLSTFGGPSLPISSPGILPTVSPPVSNKNNNSLALGLGLGLGLAFGIIFLVITVICVWRYCKNRSDKIPKINTYNLNYDPYAVINDPPLQTTIIQVRNEDQPVYLHVSSVI